MKKRENVLCMTVVAVIAAVSFLIGYWAAAHKMKNAQEQLIFQSQTFYAEITEINGATFQVEGLEENDINFRSRFFFTVAENTRLEWRYTPIKSEDFKVGDTIAVTFLGEIQETYPAKILDVVRVQRLED